MEDKFYVYAYLDPRKPGKFEYSEYIFGYEPFYIGMGQGPRIKASLSPSSNTSNILKKRKIKKIKACGQDPISIKLKINLSRNEACELEISMIKLIGKIYDKTGVLTNITVGGDSSKPHTKEWKKVLSKPVLQFKDNEFIAEYVSIKEACNATGLVPQNVGAAANGKYKTSGGFIWKYKNDEDRLQGHLKNKVQMPKHSEATRAKMTGRKTSDITKKKMSKNSSLRLAVIQVDENNNYIKEWSSITDAAIELNIHINKIRRSCQGRLPKIVEKFIWTDPIKQAQALIKQEEILKFKQKNRIKISQLKNGILIKEWDFLTQVKEGGFSHQAVTKQCKSGGGEYKGFYWKYSTQETSC